MSETVDAVTAAAQMMVGCLDVAVSQTDSAGRGWPGSVCLRTGARVDLLLAQARDECCEGLAWVRLVNSYPSRDFPEQDTTYRACDPAQWAAVLELGVARCAPVAGGAAIPTCGEWTAVSLAVMDDRRRMAQAVCCFRTEWADPDDRMMIVGMWQPIETEGGCVGGTMQVTIAVPACECEET